MADALAAAVYPRPTMTPLAALIRAARLAAPLTPAERAARRDRAALPSAPLTQEELAARCRTGGHPAVLRETIARAEAKGPREVTLGAICDALGLDVQLVPLLAAKTTRRRSRS